MREAAAPALPLRTCLALLLLLPLPAAAAPEPAAEWVVLVADEVDAAPGGPLALPPTDARADLVDVSVAEEPAWLWVRLRTRATDAAPSPAPLPPGLSPAPPESTVEFGILRAEDGTRHSVRLEAAERELVVTRDGAPLARLPLDEAQGQTPWGYVVRLARWQLLDEGPLDVGDVLERPWAATRQDATPPLPPSGDRAPAMGFGTEYVLALPAQEAAPLPMWNDAAAVDFAAGPSLAVAPDGRAHVAYVVYNAERGDAVGLYHATFDPRAAGTGLPAGWSARRVADAAMPTTLHEDGNTQTALAVTPQGVPFIAYHPAPNAARGTGIRVATPQSGAWAVEDPATVDGRRLPVDDSYRGVPSIAAAAGRVVLAFQSGNDVALVERTQGGAWRLLATLPDARFPRLALDAGGKAHVAWLGEARPDREVHVGKLLYATEAGGWTARVIAEDVEDFSSFWETSETDGSFAFALGPDGRPRFAWDATRDAPRFGMLGPLGVVDEPAPLVPGHGNPQVRMRMAVDREGRAHLLTGYGGSDLYAVRSRDGAWLVEETPRQDMAQLALTPDGRAVTAYTQPHGGTTLAFRAQVAPADTPPADPSLAGLTAASGPGGARPILLVLLTAAGAAAGWGGAVAFRALALRLPWRLLAAVGGFSRIARPRLAEHEARDAILRAARDEPGVGTDELRHRMGLPRSTFLYHVRRLEKERLLVVRRDGARLLLAPPGVPLAPEAALAPPLRDLLAAVRAHPEGTVEDYARRLGAPRRTTAHRLGLLEQDGRVAPTPPGVRPRRWRAP